MTYSEEVELRDLVTQLRELAEDVYGRSNESRYAKELVLECAAEIETNIKQP